MSEKYYLNDEETVLLKRECGGSRILANWRDLEETYSVPMQKVKIRYMWEHERDALGLMIENGELATYLQGFSHEAANMTATIAEQMGGGAYAEAMAREVARAYLFEGWE